MVMGVVVVSRETKLELTPLTLLNVAHMITEEALSNLSVQKNVLLPIMASLPSAAFLTSRNSMLYLTAHLVSSSCHSTRRLLQSVSLTRINLVTLTKSGVTKRN